MTPDVVVDIGNTRIKWGRCYPDGIPGLVSLAPDPGNWDLQAAAWNLTGPVAWAVASVHPDRLKRFTRWATARGDQVQVTEHAHIPLRVEVEEPEKVGIDRLLAATAAARRTPGRTLVVASVGTAVTVDFVSPNGAFAGGAIFPGLRTMTRALHDYTAALPAVEITGAVRQVIGKNTTDAIRSGVFWAVVGGIAFLATHGHQAFGVGWPKLYLTGGDAGLFDGYFNFDPEVVPTLTLEGVRIAAEAIRE